MRTAQQIKNICDGCQRAIIRGKSNKEYISVSTPYGYKIDRKARRLVIDKKVAFIVYLIFDLYDKGLGLTTIAKYLNERMIATPTLYKKTGEYILSQPGYILWEKSTIREMIQNQVYNGKYRYSDEYTHQKIINDSLWERVCIRREEKRNRGGIDHYDHNGNEFCNLIYCSCCNKPFTLEKSKCREGIISYLRCSSYDRRGSERYHCDNKLAIRYSELRDIVNMFIKEEIFNKISLDDLQKDYYNKIKNNNENEIAIHREYLKEEKNELIRLKEKYENMIIEDDNSLIAKINIDKKNMIFENINNRLIEVEKLLKEIYGFARTITVSDKEFYLDRYIFDTFVSRINIGILEENKRDILIELK